VKLHTKNKNVVHTGAMRRGVSLLVLGVLAAAIAAASAQADGTGTTPGTTTTTTTTTGTTTTSAPPAFARLAPSYLPETCVGAGAATIAEPGRPIIALGTPAVSLGPSAYPANKPLVAFQSSDSGGSTCKTTHVALQSVSLLRGAVTATSVQATAGRGSTTDLEIDGSPAGLAPGQMTAIGNWAQLYLGKRVGRLAAPLVVVLLAPHDGLPAGTTITVAFAAAAQPAVTPAETQHSTTTTTPGTATTPAAGSQRKIRQGQKRHRPRHTKPPPDFPALPSPFLANGEFRDALQNNPIVSTAMRYLGIPYQWGGASPDTGFDCSGLVKYVFSQLGVPLVHYAAAQWHSPGGVWVPPDRLEPGDLVFFIGSDGTRKAPGHVGIYVGDGYFIDAPHTGSFVRVDSLTEPKFANQYVGARKVVSKLLVARHPSHVTEQPASATAFPLGFPSPVTFRLLGESLEVAGAGAPTVRAASRGDWVWAGVGLGGVIALLSTVGVSTVRRRRRRPAEETSS
jgi:cell wall-associated NlpC family hydrolase